MLEYYNKLPRYVYINKEKFVINTDYRIFIKFEMGMQGVDTKKAIYDALKGFYPAFNLIYQKGYIDEAVNKFIWFYKCGKEDYEHKITNSKHKAKISEVYNYKYDCDLICGSYLIYAHKNLHKYLHWWEFKEIWNTLPPDCEYSKIKGYRAYDGKDKEMLELKDYYTLPPTEAEIKDQIRRDKIYESLK